MPMKFGISMFGALQTDEDEIRNAIERSFREAEISVYRGPWLIWYPPGAERSLILPNGALNEAILPRLVNMLNFSKQFGVHLQLVGAPNVMVGGQTAGNLNRYYDAWGEIISSIAEFDSTVWSVDLFNEQSGKDNDGSITKRLYDITRDRSPDNKITVSMSYSEMSGLSAVERDVEAWFRLRQDHGIVLDYYAAHFNRQPPSQWAQDNQDRFERLTNRLQGNVNPGETLPAAFLDESPEVWDDEGAREGYGSDFGFPIDDPTVDDAVLAAQGAENAGCYVHVLHTGANFEGEIDLSPTELIKIQRIKDEVIDDIEAPPPPVSPPDIPPEVC